MTDCAKCGACTVVCPVYQVTGQEFLTARGRIHLLDRLPVADCSATYADILSKCLLCGACRAVCPRGLDIPALITLARSELAQRTGDHPFLTLLTRKALSQPPLLEGLAALSRLLPATSGLRLRLGLTERASAPSPIRHSRNDSGTEQAQTAYFSGCLARHLEPQIATASRRLATLADSTSPWTPESQVCCGQAALAAGNLREARRLARRNIAAFEARELPILTSCASCYSHLATYPALLADDRQWQQRAEAFAGRLRELTSFLVDNPTFVSRYHLPATAPRPTVLYHDPCHLRHHHRITAPPRRLLTDRAGFELRELPHGPQCCGMGGLFHLAHPSLSQSIRTRMLDDFAALAPGILVTTTCSGCLIYWRQGLARRHSPTAVKHLAVLLSDLLPE